MFLVELKVSDTLHHLEQLFLYQCPQDCQQKVTSFEVFMAAKVQLVCWVVMLCSVVR